MRRLAFLALVLQFVALARRASAEPASSDDTAQDDAAEDAPPKGRIVNPWGHLPHPRDHMRLPDPRRAVEKAAADGTIAPTEPDDVEPPSEPQVTSAPAATASAPAPAVAAMPPLPPPSTPFGVTTMRLVPPPAVAPHEGLTLEAGTGIGWIHVSDENNQVTSPGGVAGLSIGVGGWLDENVALTARIAGSSVPSSEGLVIAAFLGPSVQLWFSDRTWLGVGLGLATFALDANDPEDDVSLGGYAGDLRLGHTLYANGSHTLNASVEITPGRVTQERSYGGDYTLNVTSVGLLVGWQYL